ncbi:Aconitate hydratase [Patulibacter medicamentivorans]|uniref:Aconitate hydratase A n=1 Tax=Patulibacter medicamentivorans TaxID=1097667 RepID=H0E895_9ACTN|nr:aconitate hydratase [Patulibacter medicamentivorans]EHN10096.1 Aconitate hydratase [Patulibacter medicamentivorans]
MTTNSFGAKDTLSVGDRSYEVFRLDALQSQYDVARLPYSLKVLLENLLRTEGNGSVTKEQIEALATWDAKAEPADEIAFTPARVVLQDFTGVPAVVDLAAMRDAMGELGGDPSKIEPLVPAELVIDHSVQVDAFGNAQAFAFNAEKEFERNKERYQFLRWGQEAFESFKVVPPDTGIVHQVNLEYLSRSVFVNDRTGQAYPDTLVGTDSHTTMVNGLGVLGWGVGGIEAEAAMLGQPIPMLIPNVIGFRLKGELREGATATDLVLTVTELLRKTGVVGKFVEFFGEGVTRLPLADRATIGNMSPEFGSTAAIFPIDAETIRYMAFTGRPKEQLELVEAYAKAQGLWHDPSEEPTFSQVVELDLGDVVPSIAGPKRPQDRVSLSVAKDAFRSSLGDLLHGDDGPSGPYDKALDNSFPASDPPSAAEPSGSNGSAAHPVEAAAGDHHHGTAVLESKTSVQVEYDGRTFPLDHGHVVIAAITSCTNTSNPSVMVAAGLVARKAAALGLNRKPWVKTSLAPGSMVVTDYLERAGLNVDLDALGFNLVGYGCTTCIGNSGPLPEPISKAVNEADLSVTSVLSGNRNFEGRISPDVKMNYLASPPLVVAYALAGTMDFDFEVDPLGQDQAGNDVFLKDVWPTTQEVAQTVEECLQADMFRSSYAQVFDGDENWRNLDVPTGDRYAWDASSTYVQKAPYFDGMPADPEPVQDIAGARVLAKLGDSVTTDHISPAGSIKRDAPAGTYLEGRGVKPADFNSYGSRRGSHDVMIRGTFANIRLRNQLAPGTEGGVTRYLLDDGALPAGETTSIFEASEAYQKADVPLVVLGGKEYGSGSSRDWAAKGTNLLGVRAVITESFERIHRSNLVGMGVLPLQFPDGESAESLGLTGEEAFTITGLAGPLNAGELPKTVQVQAGDVSFEARVRIDTPKEADYYRHGGILRYVLRQLVAAG